MVLAGDHVGDDFRVLGIGNAGFENADDRGRALVAGAPASLLGRLTRYGEHLGLAFQIADDVIDASAAPAGDGRSDRRLGKATYPAAVGLSAARACARSERDAALQTIRSLGAAAEPLRAIAAYVIVRMERGAS